MALGLVLAGCGTSTDQDAGSTTTASRSAATSTSRAAPPTLTTTTFVAPAPKGHPTIDSYIQKNRFTEAFVRRGEPATPVVTIPVPPGWQDAGPDTPPWAYAAMTYTGPDAGEYKPNIIAKFIKLTGGVDPQRLIELAPGELMNRTGYTSIDETADATLAGHPAYQMRGTWSDDGRPKFVAQKTVVIAAPDAVYVLTLTGDGTDQQAQIVGDATTLIDEQTTIA